MPNAQTESWLCKNCGECVDPTMDLCWACGHDREGQMHPTVFVEPVEVDLTRCGVCEYPLKGNPDATHCPECGEPVPWLDCADCGARAPRVQMEHGCPACRAAKTGQAFEPVVQRMDEPYDPARELEQQRIDAEARARRKVYRVRRLIVLVLLLIPGCVVMGGFAGMLLDRGLQTASNALVLGYFSLTVLALFVFMRAMAKDLSHFKD